MCRGCVGFVLVAEDKEVSQDYLDCCNFIYNLQE